MRPPEDTWPDISDIDNQQVEVLRSEEKKRASSGSIRLAQLPRRHLVLVVEDDEDIRQSLCYILEDEGIATLSAGDGQQALDLLNGLGEKPTVILLDLSMPVMDGREFLQHMGKDPALAPIPVVIVSALTRDEKLGGVTWLQKPVGIDGLLAAIAAAGALTARATTAP
ncbi:MAG TPA: response regulator [Polyangiaceae bacterium]|jgi:CheY-like chemotaxis protein